MIKYCLINSMIGNYYPFFLSNADLKDSFYLYRIVSPSLSDECVPYLTLEKVGEKNKNDQPSKDIDVIAQIFNSKKNVESKAVDYLVDLLKKEQQPVIEKNGDKFPLIEMGMSNSIQKSVVVGLRDTLRWKFYRFYPGRFVDILWTPTKFVVFQIKGDDDKLWLEPVGMYRNIDVSLQNPIKIDLTKLDIPNTEVTGKNKASDLNRIIKSMEWGSFTRKEIKI